MAREQLNSDGAEVDEGEVAKVTVSFKDYSGVSLTTAQFASLTLTIRSGETHEIINSRDSVSVLNANGGTVADVDGKAVLTLVLTEQDNANVSGVMNGVEQHWIDLVWTWNDGDAVRTGKAAYSYDVRVLEAPSMEVDWTG